MSDSRQVLRRMSERFSWLADHHVTSEFAKIECQKLADECWQAQAAADQPGDAVRIPTSADEAALMVLLGTDYLKRHAPERLRASPQPDAARDVLEAERRDADQLAGLLLSNPETGETLWISGPPIPAHLSYSTILLRSSSGEEWTLTFRLQEGNHPGSEKRANVLRGIREECAADNSPAGPA